MEIIGDSGILAKVNRDVLNPTYYIKLDGCRLTMNQLLS